MARVKCMYCGCSVKSDNPYCPQCYGPLVNKPLELERERPYNYDKYITETATQNSQGYIIVGGGGGGGIHSGGSGGGGGWAI